MKPRLLYIPMSVSPHKTYSSSFYSVITEITFSHLTCYIFNFESHTLTFFLIIIRNITKYKVCKWYILNVSLLVDFKVDPYNGPPVLPFTDTDVLYYVSK